MSGVGNIFALVIFISSWLRDLVPLLNSFTDPLTTELRSHGIPELQSSHRALNTIETKQHVGSHRYFISHTGG
jgi:hypothetical protein